jgi:quercetin 2,3-dioxygenase
MGHRIARGDRRMSIRPVIHEGQATPTMEGAGVHLHRAFGFGDPGARPVPAVRRFPQRCPRDYYRGFPWHPHRGIETITYVLAGFGGTWRQPWQPRHALGRRRAVDDRRVGHPASGNAAGNARGQMHGFQLWANLPSALKMTAPRYQDVKGADIPRSWRMTARHPRQGDRGQVLGQDRPGGRHRRRSAIPRYLRAPGKRKTFKVDTWRRAFAYVFDGRRQFPRCRTPARACCWKRKYMGQEVNIRDMSGNRTLVRFGTGDEVTVQAGPEGIRFPADLGRSRSRNPWPGTAPS